jgi:hypothetical protein
MQLLHRRLSAIAVILLSLCIHIAPITAAQAGPYEEALTGFTADSFSETADAINALAVTGSPRAAIVLEALQKPYSSRATKTCYRRLRTRSRRKVIPR